MTRIGNCVASGMLVWLACGTALAQEAPQDAAKRIEFDEFLAVAGEDIAREFASCAGNYAIWAATVETQGNTENAAQLGEITQYAIDAAMEAARGARGDGEADTFVRGYMIDTVNLINKLLEAPDAEWSTVYEIYDEACRWALDNQEMAIEQWTARTAARLAEQGYELGEPPAEEDR